MTKKTKIIITIIAIIVVIGGIRLVVKMARGDFLPPKEGPDFTQSIERLHGTYDIAHMEGEKYVANSEAYRGGHMAVVDNDYYIYGFDGKEIEKGIIKMEEPGLFVFIPDSDEEPYQALAFDGQVVAIRDNRKVVFIYNMYTAVTIAPPSEWFQDEFALRLQAAEVCLSLFQIKQLLPQIKACYNPCARILYVDETENEEYFIVTGLLVDSEAVLQLAYKRFKRKIESFW